MIQDIIEPPDASQLIKFEHSGDPNCLACRVPDRMKKSIGRTYHKIKEFNASLDTLPPCPHTNTKLIVSWPDELIDGVVLDAMEMTYCRDCRRIVEDAS